MRDQTLDQAIVMAVRLIEEARKLRAARKHDKTLGTQARHPRESGATRRASMELTRALADLRQGR